MAPKDIGGRRYQTGKHLESFCLLLLLEEPGHGGMLLKRLQEMLPDGWCIDGGGVYRLLRDLERDGSLRSTWSTDDGGAPKRLYEVTPAGQERLRSGAEEIALRRDTLSLFLNRWQALDAQRRPTDREERAEWERASAPRPSPR